MVNGRVVQVELDDAWAARGVTLGRLADLPTAAALAWGIAGQRRRRARPVRRAEPGLLPIPSPWWCPPGVQVDRPSWWSTGTSRGSGRELPPSAGQPRRGRRGHGGRAPRRRRRGRPGRARHRAGRRPGRPAGLPQRAAARARSTWQIASQQSRRSSARPPWWPAQAALGGDYARTRADCRLVGRGATGNLLAVYFGEGDQTLDFRTFQDHAAPDTTSNLLFKGAVGGQSRSVYTGLIRVRPEGRGHQRLPDQPQHQAERPRLGRVGAQPRDREQRRPLQPRLGGGPDRRGAALLPREPGRAHRRWPSGCIVAGFFDEVLDQLPVPDAVDAAAGRRGRAPRAPGSPRS